MYPLVLREVHPDQYRRYMDFEAEATSVVHYAAHVMPGLLQTEAYARACLGCQADLSADQVNERVTARMGRQGRLRSDSPPHVGAILDESVIRHTIGSREVMYAQLASLLGQMDTPNTKIQVAPFDMGVHALLVGSLTLLTRPDGSTVAYEEGIETSRLYEDLQMVQKYQRAYDAIRANALSLTD